MNLSPDQIETLKIRQPMKLQVFYALTPTYNKHSHVGGAYTFIYANLL